MSQTITGYPTTKTGPDEPCDVTTTLDPATDKCALDVNVEGGSVTTTPGGGGISSLVTTILTTVDDSGWTAIITTPTRVGVTIQNQSGFEIKVNGATPAGYDGVVLRNNSERFYDANASATINLRSTPGSGTVSPIVIEEVLP